MSRDNYNPYRIVGAKKIDVWFYEEGDMRRTHRIVYELIILPLYGVCENSYLDYRHHSDELLELFIQPPYIEVPHIQENVPPPDGRAAPQTAHRSAGGIRILTE